MEKQETNVLEKYKERPFFDYFTAACQKTMSNLSHKDFAKLIRLLIINHDIPDFRHGTLCRLRSHLHNICVSKLEKEEYEGYFMTSYLLTRIKAIINHYEKLENFENLEK